MRAQPAARSTRAAPWVAAWAVIALLLLCGGGAAAVQLRAIDPPQGSIDLGAARLVAQISSGVSCTRLQNPSCLMQRRQPRDQVYTIWLLSRPQANGRPATLRPIASFALQARQPIRPAP